MRLIDADELLTHIEDYGEGQSRLDLISPYYVHNAPTVDAIPRDQLPTTKNDLGVDCISRKSIKQKLQEHHDFFVNAYGGFSNLPQNDQSRVDEITNCIAMVVNEPPVTPQEPRWILDSERCPEKTGRYLITYYNRYQDTTETQEAFFVEEDDEFKWYDTTEIEITLAVIAWMPLPEPYEPQESEDEK